MKNGIRQRGRKFVAEIKVNRKTIYVGSADNLEGAQELQRQYRETHNIEEPKRGRPKKRP